MNKGYIILLICCSCSYLRAQEPPDIDSLLELEESLADTTSDIVKGDTILLINDVTLPEEKINTLKRKKDLLYLKKLDSLLKEKQKQDNLALRGKEGSQNISLIDRFLNSSFLKVFLWTLALIFIFFILYNLLLSKGIFKKPAVSLKAEEQNKSREHFYGQDFVKLLSQSCRLGDYRMAVRYLFLHTLQQLNDKSIIELASDKTNRDYASEIQQDKKNDFAALVLNYEYIWYGNIKISKDIYENVEKKFTGFLGKI